MAGISVIDIDIGKAAPLVGVAALGLAIWYIWHKSRQDDANQPVSPIAQYQAADDLALIQSFTGGSSVPTQATTAAGTTMAVQNPSLPTYSAPGNPAQNYTASATLATSLGPASATSNGI